MQNFREMQVILFPTTFWFTSLFLFLDPPGTTIHLTQQDLQVHELLCLIPVIAHLLHWHFVSEMSWVQCFASWCFANFRIMLGASCAHLESVISYRQCVFSPKRKQIAFRDRKQAAHGRVTICTRRCTCCWDQYLFLVKVPMTFVQLELSPPHTPHLSYCSLDPMMPSQPVRMHFPRTHTELL